LNLKERSRKEGGREGGLAYLIDERRRVGGIEAGALLWLFGCLVHLALYEQPRRGGREGGRERGREGRRAYLIDEGQRVGRV